MLTDNAIVLDKKLSNDLDGHTSVRAALKEAEAELDDRRMFVTK